MHTTTSSPRLTRRALLDSILAMAALGATGGLLAACTPSPTPTTGPAPTTSGGAVAPAQAPASAPTQGPKSGGNLTVATTGDITTFDAFVTSFINYPIRRQVYNTLLRYDAQIKPQPELAEKWDVSPDGLTATLKIRQGVKFHNGRTMTAQDVVDNLMRAKDPKTGGSMVNWASSIKSATASDNSTVAISLNEIAADLVELFCRITIIAPEQFDQLKGSGVGTGPFKFVEWLPGDRVVLERFADYWDKSTLRLDRVTFKPFSDMEALATALEAGTVDAAIAVPYTYAERLQSKLTILRSNEPPPGLYVMFLNPHQGPFVKKEVRQGFEFALDRATMIKQVLFGVGDPSVVPYGKTSLGYDDNLAKSVTFDLSKAKELFAKAGFPNGFQASTMAPTAYPELVSMAQVLKADLATIAVQLDIEPLDIAQWTPRLLAGNYQASFSFIGSTHTDPASITANSALRVVNNPIFPQGDLPQAYVDGINAGKATLDVAKRKAAYKQTQETLLSEGWAQFISWKYTLFPSQKYVKDLAISVDDEILLEKAWLDK